MTVIQRDTDRMVQLNAIWQHSYDDGHPVHTLGLYFFDADGKPAGHAQLTDEGRARLRRVLDRE